MAQSVIRFIGSTRDFSSAFGVRLGCLPSPKVNGNDQEPVSTIEFHILPQTPNGKGIQTILHKVTAVQAESQEDSSFAADGHSAILTIFNIYLERIIYE